MLSSQEGGDTPLLPVVNCPELDSQEEFDSVDLCALAVKLPSVLSKSVKIFVNIVLRRGRERLGRQLAVRAFQTQGRSVATQPRVDLSNASQGPCRGMQPVTTPSNVCTCPSALTYSRNVDSMLFACRPDT